MKTIKRLSKGTRIVCLSQGERDINPWKTSFGEPAFNQVPQGNIHALISENFTVHNVTLCDCKPETDGQEVEDDYESELEHWSSPSGCHPDCPACEDEREHRGEPNPPQYHELEVEVKRLRAIIIKERAAVARFLVPHRTSLAESWLDFFVEEGIVRFDGIGFVYPKELEGGSDVPTETV